MWRGRRKLALVSGLVAVGSVAVGVAYAAIPGAGGVIQGCYDSGGNLKVVSALPCPKSYTPLQWNQQGVKGDTGATGATGATGDLRLDLRCQTPTPARWKTSAAAGGFPSA